MSVPTVAVFVRLYEQGGLPSSRSTIRAQLQGIQVFNGYVLPELTEAVTDDYGYTTLHLWPNVLGSVPSTYKFTIIDDATNKSYRFYAVVPDQDIYLDQLTPVDPAGDNPLDPNQPPLPGAPGRAATIQVGTVTTVDPSQPAEVTNSGTTTTAVFDFKLPKGEPGVNGQNGTGTMVVGTVTTLPPGSNATVVNVGTDDRAVLNFGLPQGEPGQTGVVDGSGSTVVGIPAGGTDGQYLAKNGSGDYAVQWRPLPASTGGSGGTLLSFHGLYTWEGGTGEVPVPPDAGLVTMDATTLSEYRAAIAAAANGSKRQQAAGAVQLAMGSAQRMIVRRNGVQIINADFTGQMPVIANAGDVFLGLSILNMVAPIVAGDATSGTWTTTISGGAGFSRTLTFTASADATTAPGMGFNPTTQILLPRSLDGLA